MLRCVTLALCVLHKKVAKVTSFIMHSSFDSIFGHQVDAYMERIVAQYPNLVTLVNAGKSFENRDIKYLKVS